jgi:hypothetical protein
MKNGLKMPTFVNYRRKSLIKWHLALMLCVLYSELSTYIIKHCVIPLGMMVLKEM